MYLIRNAKNPMQMLLHMCLLVKVQITSSSTTKYLLKHESLNNGSTRSPLRRDGTSFFFSKSISLKECSPIQQMWHSFHLLRKGSGIDIWKVMCRIITLPGAKCPFLHVKEVFWPGWWCWIFLLLCVTVFKLNISVIALFTPQSFHYVEDFTAITASENSPKYLKMSDWLTVAH